MKQIMYHGSNKRRYKYSKESSFTLSKDTAIDYAWYWTHEYGGKPYLHSVYGEFIYVGGADEYHLKNNIYIVKTKLIKK